MTDTSIGRCVEMAVYVRNGSGSFQRDSEAADLILALRAELDVARAERDEAVDAIDAALNMVDGDGMPPNWDWLRQIKAAHLSKHGASSNG